MNSPHTRRMALSAALALLAVTGLGLAFSAPPARAAHQSLDLNLGFGGNYDDNPLQYSARQRTTFKAGTRPERYSISSLDDFKMEPTVGLAWTLSEGHGRRHVLRARYTGDFHGTNRTRDYHELSAGWREVFPHGRSLTLGFYTLPGYYLRQLAAEDYVPPVGVSNYTRAQFDLTIGSAAWDHQLSKHTDLELAYQLEHRAWVPDFKERNSDTHQGRLSVQLSGERPGTDVTLVGGYRVSKAKASDGDEVGGVADDEDVSYKGPIAGLEGRYEFSREKNTRWSGDASYLFGYRKYDSDRAFDVYHNGRHDMIHTLEAGLRYAARPHWSTRGWVKFERGDATLGAGAPTTSVVGSYSQSQVGVSIDWSGELWRTHAAVASPAQP